MCVYTLSRPHLSFVSKFKICFLIKQNSLCTITVSQSVHPLILASSFTSSSLFSPCLICVCMFLYLFLWFFWGACVSPCWQRGTTAPGIGSSSQAFGWRSTSKMKRMFVHLKVAAEVPVDVFAVNLSVISNPGWFGFHFYGFPHK